MFYKRDPYYEDGDEFVDDFNDYSFSQWNARQNTPEFVLLSVYNNDKITIGRLGARN